MGTLRASVAVIVLIVAAASTARAQVSDTDLAKGYRLLYEGDKPAATRYFETLLTTSADDLAARFGLLLVLNQRLDTNPNVMSRVETGLDSLITLADKRYDRNKRDLLALRYLALACMLRAEFRFERDKGMLGAARDGARAKGLIDTYLKQRPDDDDAYFVIGLYNYYVDLIPTFAKIFRTLMFMPPGNRAEGLKQIERVATHGPLLGPEAQMILVEIYSSLEGRPADALALGERLRQQYPANDDIDFVMGDLYSAPAVEDYVRAAATYQEVIDRRRVDATYEGSTSRYRSLLGLSAAYFSEWRVADAVTALAPPIDAGVTNPDWVMPQFLLRRGNYRALLADGTAADDARRVLADARMSKWHQGATDQLKWIDQRRASGEESLYASLIPANRLVAEGKWDAARQAYEPIRASHPQNALVQFRLAYLDFARGDTERALPVLTAVSANRSAPGYVRANALLYVGRVYDLAGRREDARKAYQRVVDDFEKERAADGARLGLITPYRRPVKLTDH